MFKVKDIWLVKPLRLGGFVIKGLYIRSKWSDGDSFTSTSSSHVTQTRGRPETWRNNCMDMDLSKETTPFATSFPLRSCCIRCSIRCTEHLLPVLHLVPLAPLIGRHGARLHGGLQRLHLERPGTCPDRRSQRAAEATSSNARSRQVASCSRT